MIKLKFVGGVSGSVTGACYLLDTGKTKVLIDCGMFQGSRFSEKLNSDPFPFDVQSIDAMILTHAHIDHSGRVPKLYKDGYKGKIYGTAPTLDFSHVMLLDSEHVIREEAKRDGMDPFYNIDDVNNAFKNAESRSYGEEVVVSDDVRFVLRNAAHILGSSIVELFVKKDDGSEIKVLFSGDLGNYPAIILGDVDYVESADYIVVESAYGDRLHENLEKRKDVLENIIEETIHKDGVLMIPAFAAERTQEILYEFNELVENGRIKRVPVFLDSPLAIKITEIYKRHEKFFSDETRKIIAAGDDIFNFPGLKFTKETEQSKAIADIKGAKIIIAGSGMSNGGRILHHEKRYLSDPKNTLLIIGYQVKGSLGRRLLDGEKKVRIKGEEVDVRARIENIRGYSAHADQDQLLSWLNINKHSAKKIFVVQGDEDASNVLVHKIKDRLAVSAEAPKMEQEVILD